MDVVLAATFIRCFVYVIIMSLAVWRRKPWVFGMMFLLVISTLLQILGLKLPVQLLTNFVLFPYITVYFLTRLEK